MNHTSWGRCGEFILLDDLWLRVFKSPGVLKQLAVVPVSNFPTKRKGLHLRDFKRVARPITLKSTIKQSKRMTYVFLQDVNWLKTEKNKTVAGVILYSQSDVTRPVLGFVSMGTYKEWPKNIASIDLSWTGPALEIEI